VLTINVCRDCGQEFAVENRNSGRARCWKGSCRRARKTLLQRERRAARRPERGTPKPVEARLPEKSLEQLHQEKVATFVPGFRVFPRFRSVRQVE
jgi:hypothetical protein